MAISSNAPVSLTDIQDEFGGTSPISLSEYYSAAVGVPASGTINMGAFRGASASTTITDNTNYLQINASSYISAGGTLTIPSSVWIWSDSTSTPALNIDVANATIINNGKIIGKGGNGGYGNNSAGQAGGPAIKISASGVQITNNSGAYIAGGGGGGAGGRCGGGGGAGGGVGGGSTATASDGAVWVGYGGAGGAVGQAGGKGTGNSWRSTVRSGNGGGAGGGGGGTASDYGGSYNGSGGGGGRILPGTGGASQPTGNTNPGSSNNVVLGTAPAGGSANGNGGNGAHSGGGGGWGASGGGTGSISGGVGGSAIQIASGSSGYTNSGTIYGSNAATLRFPYISGTHYVSNGSATSSLNSDFGTYTLHRTVWDYRQSGYIWTFTVASNATGSLRFRSTADPDAAPRNNSGNDRILRLYKNGGQVASATAVASGNATIDRTYSTTGGDVWKLYMDNSLDWRDLGGFERITNIYITGA